MDFARGPASIRSPWFSTLVRPHAGSPDSSTISVHQFEAHTTGGLRVASRAAALDEALRRTDNLVLKAAWADWFGRSFLQQLDDAATVCASLGITRDAVEHRILPKSSGGRAQQPRPPAQAQRLRQQFQRTVQQMLPQPSDAELEQRARHKMERWRVDVFPRIRAINAVAFLKTLRGKVPPRAWAAVWRALWNGWATHRRTQGREGMAGCMFCCSDEAPDSLEHYASCQWVQAVAGQQLRLHRRATPESRLASLLGLDWRPGGDEEVAVRVAIRLAALYRVHCLCRHGHVQRGAAAAEALGQSCREVVRGCQRATHVYDLAVGWQ